MSTFEPEKISSTFSYRRISLSLIKEIKDTIYDGESVALLGARYAGKGFIMDRIYQELTSENLTDVIWVDLPNRSPINTPEALRDTILAAVTRTSRGQSITAESNDDLFSPIDQLTKDTEKPAIVLFPYVDGIAHSLARDLLRSVRSRVSNKKIVALLCGEMDLRNLVHGPNSEFNCAYQYVIQGFALDEFTVQMRRYALMLNLRFADEANAAKRLWELSGGNIHVLRILLGSILELCVHGSQTQMKDIELSEIPQDFNQIEPSGMRRSEVFQYARRLINYESDCWNAMSRLIQGQQVEFPGTETGPPSHLELAGAAVREGRTLRFTSPLMAEFLRGHYDHRRFGDLYARVGKWDDAFGHYEHLSPVERLRPLSADDRSEVLLTVKAFCAALYSKATEGVEAVKRFFALGCRGVLGFGEVTFWQRETTWKIQPFDGFPSNNPDREEMTKILPTDNTPPGILSLPETWQTCGMIATLPATRPEWMGAVVVGNYDNRIVISHERKQLASEMLKHFGEAYSHALQVEINRQRLDIRNKLLEVINTIFTSLGKEVINPKQVLEVAAYGLRKLGYKRVLFCLVDPERKRIQGVFDCSDNVSVDVADMTNFPLDNPLRDIQPYVVLTKQWRIVKDASRDPLANQDAVRLAEMHAEAIGPIFKPSGEVLGTIHIEREDGAVPTNDEVRDLETFGRQLAVAIEQSERINLLQSAMNKIPEPLIIVDSATRIRYTNQPGATLLSIPQGWRESAENLNALHQQEFDEDVQKIVRETLNSGQRNVHHVAHLAPQSVSAPADSEYRREVLADVLKDWQGKTIGGLLHVQDMSYLYQVSKAFQRVFDATDAQSAIEAMLDAAKLLKYKWGRLYLIDEKDSELLVPRLSFGFHDKEREQLFNEGRLQLPRKSTPNVESWMSIEQGEPVVFYYTKSYPDRSQHVTPYGLKATVIHQTQRHEELEKADGDMWLDIPLGTREFPLGKMTLDCAYDLRPENFEIMKMLLGIASSTLAAKLRGDRETIQRMQSIRVATAEKIMASLAHNIATRLAAMPLLLARYRAREANPHDIKSLNDNFQHILGDTLTTINRAKERLAGVAVKTATVDLHTQIRRALRTVLPDKCISVESALHPFEAEVDSHLLELAILEMVQNTRVVCPDQTQLRISVLLEPVEGKEDEWLRLIYEDNGPGVPAELKSRIFEDFFSRRPQQKSSTGLGLGFVRRVVEAHSGYVVESGVPGQGARFTISLPKKQISTQAKENGYVSHSDR